MLMLDQTLHKNHLYSTFVHLLTTEKHHDKRHRSRSTSRNNSYNKHYSQNRYRSHLEIDFITTKVLLLHNTLDHDMIHKNAIHGLTVRHTDHHIDLLIDQTLVLDIDHALIQENTISQNIQIHTDHLLDQETLDTLDLVHILTLEIKSIRYNPKTNLNLKKLKYTCIIQRQWQTLYRLQVGFLLYMFIHLQVWYKETTHLDSKLHYF